MYSINSPCRHDSPVPTSHQVLAHLRERLRYLHYSLQTEKNYVYWSRWFIRWHGMRHPKEMGGNPVEAFMLMLANERKVAPSTRRQALSALSFLYKEVLDVDLPWVQEMGRPVPRKRTLTLLTMAEMQHALSLMDGATGLLARLLYGTGMRLLEGLSLRVKDIDFARDVVTVRKAKGRNERIVMMPAALKPLLKEQLEFVRQVWEADRQGELGEAALPSTREQELSQAENGWRSQWVFPSPTVSRDPVSGVMQRHHLYPELLQRALKQAVEEAGIDKQAAVHILRHGFAAGLSQGACDNRGVRKLFGDVDFSRAAPCAHVLKIVAGVAKGHTKNRLDTLPPLDI